MLLVRVTHKFNLEQRTISDRELVNYDTRLWDVEWNIESKEEETPTSIIEVYVKGKKGAYTKEMIPIFSMEDLNKTYLSASSHLILRGSLSPAQKEWLEAKREGLKMMG